MASKRDQAFKPRKQPVQGRSGATVAALFEASIQVMLAVGYRKMTTTRIAERAGVSVGTLYQYFPNRQALITSVIERYLEQISLSVQRDCQALDGGSLDEIASGLVDALISAKWRHIDVARAMQEPLVDVGGVLLVREATKKGVRLVSALLANCRDAEFERTEALGLFILTACSSLLQTAIAGSAGPIDVNELRANMYAMVRGYLKETGRPKSVAHQRNGNMESEESAERLRHEPEWPGHLSSKRLT
jgi:AcrR family transcriptional regulator